MGPTCSGKTGAAVELVQRLPLEIINVDSALVYQGLEIGAARPEPEVLAKAPHRLLGFLDPSEPYSAARFREDALGEIADIHANGKIPLLVGGTMLYFKALQQGLADLPAADPVVREAIDAIAREHGWPEVHRQLAEVDPETAARLKPNDGQRLQRALEVYRLTGEPLSALHRKQKSVALSDTEENPSPTFPYTATCLALAPTSRALLHERIAVRFHTMLEDGLVEEVRQLKSRGDLHRELPAIKAVGYRQVWDYLDGLYSYEEMVDRGIIATRQLAKRQFTWLRGWPELEWFDSDHPQLIERLENRLAPLLDSVFS
ncbi:MAG: tRNA (adenosine(37)-N6)-dimethylallyltransferase MiaA [Alcanivoracaceae bacterium]|jgi:tRNA dimethylallyltransferase|nr:tRNA (adenosine(37)-N6)-dimethylallyltransferase MiaA [Alcanivoracaceae bacterium]